MMMCCYVIFHTLYHIFWHILLIFISPHWGDLARHEVARMRISRYKGTKLFYNNQKKERKSA